MNKSIVEVPIAHSGIISKNRFGKSGLLPFTISDTDFKVPPAVEHALKERMEHPIFGYTRWNHDDFKEAITNWYVHRFDTVIEKRVAWV